MKKNKILIAGMIGALLVGTMLTGCNKNETKVNSEGETIEYVYENDYVKLANYKGIEYSDQITEVTDEDVEQRIQEYLEANAEYEQISEGTVEDGATVNISFVGTIAGEDLENGEAQNVDITVGSGSYLPGLEEGIIGMSVGETKDISTTFPDNYGDENLNGKDVTFTVTVNYLCGEQSIIPELTDEYVQSVSDAQTVDEYKTLIKEELASTNESSYDSNVRMNLINYIVENSEFKEIPEDMIAEYKERIEETYKQYAEMFSMDYEDFVTQMLETTVEDLESTLDADAEQSVKATIVFSAIAENEKLEVTDAEYDDYLAEIATEYGYESVDALKAELEENNQTEESKQECLNEKVYDLIMENAVYNATPEEESVLEEEKESIESESENAETSESAEETTEVTE